MTVTSPPAAPAPIWEMRRVPCVLCGATEHRELYASRLPDLAKLDIQKLFACTSSAYGECGPIVTCVRCGLVFQNPQPDPGSILAAYEDVVDERYAEEREGRVHTFRRALHELEEYATPGRLLDVGAHLGVFVDVARARGWEAEGIEPSRWAVAEAQSRGLPVTCGALAELEKPAGSFDVVTMWDVIEHFPDPLVEVRRAHELLDAGGVLAVSTMDVEAPVARLLGRRWPWYMQMHLVYFSRRTLARILEAAGFEVVNVRRHRRIVRAAYLVSRLEDRAPWLQRPLDTILARTGLGKRLVAVDLGDIITMFARKPFSA
jgi:2-polyprenyl-3-methyl-5-hydroxy-6-metoxy-1,4-benzoquinol methylase